MKKQRERARKSSKNSARAVQTVGQTEIIVGIGASAGGLEAIREFLEDLPEHTGLPFVVVQHLAENQVSLLPEILSRYTKIPVQKVENGVKVEPDHVYVIPPGVAMIISDGILELKPRGKALKPIDEFFSSLALERKAKAIGIVLSGTGTDGTEGLKAIKAEGGITFAQDPKTAQYPDMPQNAILSDSVYFVLPAKQIATELIRVAQHPELIRQKIVEAEPEIENLTTLQKIFSQLQRDLKVDFTHYKKSTIMRRISRRVVLNKIDSIEDYQKYLKTHPNEVQLLFDDMLIGVTEFFREPKTFQMLKELVFPKLIKDHVDQKPVRVWVPGCSTGEEVYSIAIELQEFLELNNNTLQIQIFGSDVNQKNIDKARRAIYPKNIEEHVAPERLRKFFVAANGGYQVAKRIRDLCIFAAHDVTRDPPFSGLDIIMCRNVLIYFDSILQEKVLPTLCYGLKPQGYLVLGESESVGKFTSLFEPLAKKSPIFTKKEPCPKIEIPSERPPMVVQGKKDLATIEEPTPMALVSAKIDSLLMTEYVPASFVVNNSMEVVTLRGRIQPYFAMEPGTPSFSVAKLIRKELRPSIQSLIYRARKEQKEIQDTAGFKEDGSVRTVRINVKPITVPNVDDPFFFVAIQDTKNLPEQLDNHIVKEPENHKDQQISELSEALESTKLTLQSTIEQHEATNEELRSTMEEVQSSNEELQSTNEELETTKEELQSSNEELGTLNTELKERNLELTQLSDELANLLDNVDAAIIIVDRDLKIRRFTNPAQEFLRLIPSDAGRKITDIRLNIPVEDLEGELAGVINNLQTVRREIKADNENWYQMRIRPFVTEEKKINGAVVTIIDINDLKKAEQRVRDAERFAAIGRTAAVIGHDLRNPLQGMLGQVALLEEKLDSMSCQPKTKQEIKESLEALNQMTFYMNKIVSDLQDYGRMIRPEPVETDLHQLVKETLAQYKVPENIEVSIDMPQSFPIVLVDPAIVKRALINLVTNGVQAMSDGGKLTIRVSEEKDPLAVIIDVKDTGVGIPKANLSKLFTPLFTTKSRGQGFGLAASKRLVEAHGGTITFKSYVGKGSTFTISLPLTEQKSPH